MFLEKLTRNTFSREKLIGSKAKHQGKNHPSQNSIISAPKKRGIGQSNSTVSPFAFRIGGPITRKTIALCPLFPWNENAEHGGNRISRLDDCARAPLPQRGAQSKPSGTKNKRDKNAIIRDNGLIRGIKNRKQIIQAYTFAPLLARAFRSTSSFPPLPRGTPLNCERRPLKSSGMCGEFKRAKPATKLSLPDNGAALRPIIKLTRAFALVASDGIALIPSRVCVCVHNNTRPIAVATRIALLHSSVIEIRCWTRYSFLLQKRHLSSNSERNTTRDKVFEMEIELSRAKLINSQRNVQVQGTLYKQDFKNRKIRRIFLHRWPIGDALDKN